MPAASETGQAESEAPRAYENYVALGDSYASMGTRDDFKPGSPEFCARSVDNYAADVAQSPAVDSLVDVTCQGSVIENITGPRDTGEEIIPPQIEAVTSETDLVTLSIGGNDLGFADIARCVQPDANDEESECEDELGAFVQKKLEELPSRLDALYAAIRERAPEDVTIVTTGYTPTVTGQDDCAQIANISTEDRFWIAALTFSLNTLLGAAAERGGAVFVQAPDSAAHTVCAPVDERFVDLTGEETNSYPIHPTPAGQQAMAEAVLGAI